MLIPTSRAFVARCLILLALCPLAMPATLFAGGQPGNHSGTNSHVIRAIGPHASPPFHLKGGSYTVELFYRPQNCVRSVAIVGARGHHILDLTPPRQAPSAGIGGFETISLDAQQGFYHIDARDVTSRCHWELSIIPDL